MLEFPLKNKWTIFLDKLSSSDDQNMLSMYLLQTLVHELTSKEKAYKPFWTSVYKEISEKLSLPIEIDCADLDLILSNHWSQKQEEKLQYLTIRTQKLASKNSLKTCFPSFTSSPVDKTDDGVTKLKTVQIKIFPNNIQRKHLDDMISTVRYVYNKTVEKVKEGHKPNFISLRDMLVTENTKKNHEVYSKKADEIKEIRKSKTKENAGQIEELVKRKQKDLRDAMKNVSPVKNLLLKEFEVRTHKDIRACAVKSVCDAMKSGFTNLKEGNTKYFNMKYKKKTSPVQTIEMTPVCISMKYGKVNILPKTFGKECTLKISKKNRIKHKDLVIENNVDIVKQNGEYYIHILTTAKEKDTNSRKIARPARICGVDPGIRNTCYSLLSN